MHIDSATLFLNLSLTLILSHTHIDMKTVGLISGTAVLLLLLFVVVFTEGEKQFRQGCCKVLMISALSLMQGMHLIVSELTAWDFITVLFRLESTKPYIYMHGVSFLADYDSTQQARQPPGPSPSGECKGIFPGV